MAKQTYIVDRPEVHIAQIAVEAETPQEALRLVHGGGGEEDGDEINLEYSRVIDPEEQAWRVISPHGTRDLFEAVPSEEN